MSQMTEGPLTGVSSAALGLYLRVKNGGSTFGLAGVEDDDGVVKEPALAIGDRVTFWPPKKEGTVIMVADGAISAGANVYPAASGKVTATVQGRRIGKAIAAVTADGDWVEVERTEKDTDDFEENGERALTGATMAVTAAMCKNGKVTTSHTGAATITLPAGKKGMRVTITKIDANAAAHTIDPDGAELIQGGATLATMDAQWDSVTLEWQSATVGWVITGKSIA